jgi:hypothetical protein
MCALNIYNGVLFMSIWKLIFLSRGYLISVPLIFSIFCFHSEVENEYIIVPFGLAFSSPDHNSYMGTTAFKISA